MTTHVARTWIENGKLITEVIEEKEIYKREWVGLTDEEREALTSGMVKGWVVEQLAIAIEAKLKEKNT